MCKERITALWAAVFFLFAAYVSLEGTRFPCGLTSGAFFGIFTLAGTAAFLLVTALTATDSGRKTALKRFGLCLGGAVLCCAYACLRSRGLGGSSIQDSMVCAAVFCAAVGFC